MKTSLGSFLLVGLLFATTTGEDLECVESENCNCSKPDGFNLVYQCSTFNLTPDVNITVSRFALEVDCYENLSAFPDKDAFPSINTADVKYLRVSFCPLADGNGLNIIYEKFKLENLTSVNLHNTDLSSLNKNSFAGSQLKYLHLNENNITNIDEDTFERFLNLTFVSLKSNDLHEIPSNIFKYNSELEYVNLSDNPNIELQDFVFANLPYLQRVDIDNCNLDKLPPNTFKGSVNLYHISLRNNKIEELPEYVFENMTELNSLHLDENRIKSLGKNVFSSLTNLQLLNLSENGIQEINENTFRGTRNLRILKLQSNKIEKISLDAFVELKQLVYLDLSYNKYDLSYDGDLNPFRFCEMLDILLLSHNEIQNFPENIVNNNENLVGVDLSYNKIDYVDLASLTNKKSPFSLRISVENNKVTEVDFTDVIEMLQSNDTNNTFENYTPAVLYLANNPISCDCFNLDLIRYVNNEPDYLKIKSIVDINVEDLHCGSPASLANISVQELKLNQVTCL